jgi:hypothetical protein
MSQAEVKPTTKASPKRNSAELLAPGEVVSLNARIEELPPATRDEHVARIAEARRAFERRIVDIVITRLNLTIDGLAGE